MSDELTYLLHTIPIRFHVDDAVAAQRLTEQWRPFQTSLPAAARSIDFHLTFGAGPLDRPQLPCVSSGPDVSYFRAGDKLVTLFHGWGRFDIHLRSGFIRGWMVRAAATRYGVFEDILLLALMPLLRRRGHFSIHAFAAAVGDEALALVGDTGAGKTTAGLALLLHGFRLLANDAPLLSLDDGELRLHASPGLIRAYPDSLARFPQLNDLLEEARVLDGSEKISFAAERVLPDPWTMSARPAALLFPVITLDAAQCQLHPISPVEALERLIAQSIEAWDVETTSAHMHALRRLAQDAPAYRLILAPDIRPLPDLLLPLVGAREGIEAA